MSFLKDQMNSVQETALAKQIINEHGMSSLDYFKSWRDKSFFFSVSEKSFLAYRIVGNTAMVLADPLGPEEELEELMLDFKDFCKVKKLKICLFEASADNLKLYRRLGFHSIKMGDEAIVNLEEFSLDGKKKRRLRCDRNRLEKHGYSLEAYDAYSWDHIYEEVKAISDAWLAQPGKREMGFALGDFEENYVKSTKLYVVKNELGKIVAFLNLVESGVEGELVVDLMRRCSKTQHGVMDYLYIKTFLDLKEKGFKRVSIGLAPMSGFAKHEEPSLAEKAIHSLFKNLNFLFSYQGLRDYKDKYASFWEPRHLIFEKMQDLPSLGFAVHTVFSLKPQTKKSLSIETSNKKNLFSSKVAIPFSLNPLLNFIRHRD